MTKIYLKKGRDEALRRFHPWVFSGAVKSMSAQPSEGEIVDVYSAGGDFLGRGYYQTGSIMVRILTFEDEPVDSGFWIKKLGAALELRRALGFSNEIPDFSASSVQPSSCGLPTTAYRLVHGEGDGLSGLIIDIYNRTAVIQTHTVGMRMARKTITDALLEVYGNDLDAVYDKSPAISALKERAASECDDEFTDGYLFRKNSEPESDTQPEAAALFNGETIYENGNKFLVDWEKGQKTGFFLDQRDNRALVKRYADGKKVLNLFCYTGGFSIYALNGGALSVDSVDSSDGAVEMLDRNVVLNGFDSVRHKSHCCDAMDFLAGSEKGTYDLMIVDPPAFAKHRSALNNALRAYRRLNAAAIEKVAPGGIIFTFSCSQVVDRQAFSLAVFSAAAQSRRKVRILYRLGQPADHPVNIYHPEGEYLKGLVLYVE
ncbi:MAG: class I SAM-dependent rRNA methyltransferase [Bacteroidales bacterium]|jgi:23S rRNA (cytosine1962-C5)-methyltransferase|nr:class I SAM-dependent rRNA methyltransferase [Bacteroidales bacterium]